MRNAVLVEFGGNLKAVRYLVICIVSGAHNVRPGLNYRGGF